MKRSVLRVAVLACALSAALPFVLAAAEAPKPDARKVEFSWGVKIALRDGAQLNATLYTPRAQAAPAPCIFTLTPYIAQSYHDRGMYFAEHGYPFLTVDARGRGNSQGTFRPLIQEAQDGHDVVEWLAKQPYCNGKVTMWGGSYAGYNQWATAKEFPPHLATIVPVASPYAGVDFPMRNNVFYPYDIQWLTLVTGNAAQDRIFGDSAFWTAQYRRLFEDGAPFRKLDERVGIPSPTFQEWLAHPYVDAYWDSYNPSAEQYAKLSIPILTITGIYDGDQPGAMEHYRQHMKHGNAQARARHYLVIGPWDHAGTRTPQAEFGGLKFGPGSLVDLPKLHREWYAWTMQDGPKPEFLKKPVAYYVTGAEKWRYADSLDALTAESRLYYLDSTTNANDLVRSGTLGPAPGKGKPDSYLYDPRDLSIAEVESSIDASSFVDQSVPNALNGKQLVYHTPAFGQATEVSGFFRLSAWLAIDQPDTDFGISIDEVKMDGSVIPLTSDLMRARYRESLRQAKPVATKEPLRYDFSTFTFVSREIARGSRLRLRLAPLNSINLQKNYNSGQEVSDETLADARPVNVRLHHDRRYPSVLYVPIGQPES